MCLPTLSCNQTNLQCQIFANRILDNIKLNKKQHNCSDPKLTHEEGGCDVVIPLQVLECSSCLLPVIEHNIRCNHIAPRLSKSFNSSNNNNNNNNNYNNNKAFKSQTSWCRLELKPNRSNQGSGT